MLTTTSNTATADIATAEVGSRKSEVGYATAEDAQYLATLKTFELARKIRRNEFNVAAKRVDARETWANWFLPAVRELHAAKASRVGDVIEGLPLLDENEVKVVRFAAARVVQSFADLMARSVRDIGRNNRWIVQAKQELDGRLSQSRYVFKTEGLVAA